jgi:D-alanyl-D-alanine carboxypeptidase
MSTFHAFIVQEFSATLMYNKLMKIAARKRYARLLTLLVTTLAAIGIMIVYFALAHKNAAAPAAETSSPQTSKTKSPASLILPGAKTPIPLPLKQVLLDRPDGQLILVNKTTPIDLSYAPSDLTLPTVAYRTDKSQEEVMVREALVDPLTRLFAGAKAAGFELMIGSAYRSSQLQEKYFNSYASASGLAEAEKYSAHPGTSEHQLGLAVDLTTVDRVCYLVECFAETPAGKWLAKNAHTYGFILRYPKGKEAVTGYNYEPWHFRYVGTNIATAIYESELTYEEAFPYLSGTQKP